MEGSYHEKLFRGHPRADSAPGHLLRHHSRNSSRQSEDEKFARRPGTSPDSPQKSKLVRTKLDLEGALLASIC